MERGGRFNEKACCGDGAFEQDVISVSRDGIITETRSPTFKKKEGGRFPYGRLPRRVRGMAEERGRRGSFPALTVVQEGDALHCLITVPEVCLLLYRTTH